jgi:excinuclease ABC subunit B
VREGEQHQVLLGVTGSGKTFTMAKVIEAIGKPALILAHNKTLAAQLYHEFKSFFPTNAVEYFVSYYDYYQPEAYIPSSDVYIEKEATVNDELDKLRLSATKSLFERRDCVIVASVSCIYGLGSPEAYYGMLLMLEKGQKISRQSDSLQAGRDPLRAQRHGFPPRHVPRARRRDRSLPHIRRLRLPHRAVGRRSGEPFADRSAAGPGETDLRAPADLSQDPLRDERGEPASRRWRASARSSTGGGRNWRSRARGRGPALQQRTMFDLEMMKEIGYCHGIENYSRHFSGRLPGEAPPTLLDYLPHDALMFIDESHQTCRSFTACTTATARARRCWWGTVSACRARSITAR